MGKFLRRLAAPDFVYELHELFAIGQREAVAAGRAFHRGFHAETFDGFHLNTHRPGRICLCFGDGFINGLIHFFQMVAFGHVHDVPTERAVAGERRPHAEGIFADAAGKLGVVV